MIAIFERPARIVSLLIQQHQWRYYYFLAPGWLWSELYLVSYVGTILHRYLRSFVLITDQWFEHLEITQITDETKQTPPQTALQPRTNPHLPFPAQQPPPLRRNGNPVPSHPLPPHTPNPPHNPLLPRPVALPQHPAPFLHRGRRHSQSKKSKRSLRV